MSNKFVPSTAAFRFYEDGTESGSSPIANQDINVSNRDISSGNSQFHLRVRIDETGSGSISGASTDDWTMEYRLNGAGSWSAITTSSTHIQTDTSSTLTDAAATTNRGTNGISDGAGSFFAGVQEDGNGEITDFLHQADNFTEHVWAFIAVASALNNGDSVEFRVALNGSSIASSVTPTMSFSKLNNYVLTVDAGSYTYTGATVGTLFGREVAAAQGSYEVTGATVNTLRGFEVQADAGAYTLSGSDVLTEYGRIFSADGGTYTLNGSTVGLSKGRTLVADAGSYTLTGGAATFPRTYVLAATSGSYAVTGADVSLERGYLLTVTGGSYALTGAEVSTEFGRVIQADSGSYTVSGATVNVLFGRELQAVEGSYALTGSTVNTLYGREVQADAGSYAVTGATVDLNRGTLAYTLTADSGSYSITGGAATFPRTYILEAATAAYTVTGASVGFELTAVPEAPTNLLGLGKKSNETFKYPDRGYLHYFMEEEERGKKEKRKTLTLKRVKKPKKPKKSPGFSEEELVELLRIDAQASDLARRTEDLEAALSKEEKRRKRKKKLLMLMMAS